MIQQAAAQCDEMDPSGECRSVEHIRAEINIVGHVVLMSLYQQINLIRARDTGILCGSYAEEKIMGGDQGHTRTK